MTAGRCPITHIIKRDGNVVPYDRDRITTAIFKAAATLGESNRAYAESLSLDVEHTLAEHYRIGEKPSVEDIQDVVEETLMKRGQTALARSYIIYRHQHAQARAARNDQFEATDNIPYKKIYEVLLWNIDHDCDTIDGLNKTISEGRIGGLIRASDERYEAETKRAAEKIIERLPEVRVVIVAGPSSSGKTTTTIKVAEALRSAGYELVALAVDHYFFDLESHPKDEFGDYDYETPQALDLPLINEHLERLLSGEVIRTPDYNFKTGKRTLNAHELRLESNQILLIDSLHGLYDGMTSRVPVSKKFRLYIETLGQLRDAHGNFMRWADSRLLRRMIRDSQHRALQPIQTLAHWHYVRRSELRHIIPFNATADFLVNSALPYELPVLKQKLLRFFPEAMNLFRDEPKRQDAYVRAKRILEFLNKIIALPDDSLVPDKSLLREFIGGSAYTY